MQFGAVDSLQASPPRFIVYEKNGTFEEIPLPESKTDRFLVSGEILNRSESALTSTPKISGALVDSDGNLSGGDDILSSSTNIKAVEGGFSFTSEIDLGGESKSDYAALIFVSSEDASEFAITNLSISVVALSDSTSKSTIDGGDAVSSTTQSFAYVDGMNVLSADISDSVGGDSVIKISTAKTRRK